MDYQELLGRNVNEILLFFSLCLGLAVIYFTVGILERLRQAEKALRQFWMILASLIVGVGVWGMNYVTMLSFEIIRLPHYEFLYAMEGMGLGVVSTYAALWLASSRKWGTLRLIAPSILLACGLVSMQFISMVGGVPLFTYNRTLLIVCFVISLFISFVCLWVIFDIKRPAQSLYWFSKIVFSVMMTCAIMIAQYIGLAAAKPTPSIGVQTGYFLPVRTEFLVIMFTVFIILLLVLMFVANFMNRHISDERLIKGAIFSSSIDPMIITNNEGRILDLNTSAREIFYTKSWLGEQIQEMLPSSHDFHQLIGKRIELDVRIEKNEWKTVEITVTEIHTEQLPEYLVYIRDITAQRYYEEDLQETNDRYQQLFNSSPLAIIVHRHGEIISANEESLKIVGTMHEYEVVGHSILQFIAPEQVGKVERMIKNLLKGEIDHNALLKEIKIHNMQGDELYIETRSNVIKMRGMFYVQTIIKDITETRKVKNSVRYIDYQDELTGLPNGGLFNTLAHNMLEKAKKEKTSVSVLLIDLDRFRYVNEQYGRDVGDQLLKEVVKRIKKLLVANDILSRFGSDNFLLVTSGLTRNEVHSLAKDMLEAIQEVFFIEGESISLSASIGVSLFPKNSLVLNTLIRQADLAMYHTKKHGRNNLSFYEATMKTTDTRQMMIEQGLRKAIKKNELELHYQPKVSLQNHQIVGLEALIRWNHPTLGQISPGEFIPVAEETGLIIQITEWALRTACAQNKKWQEEGKKKMRVAVNISSVDFGEESFIHTVQKVLKETNLDPRYLELEITESVAIKNIDIVVEKLNTLQGLGIFISIDDFGSGYSSLSYIKKLPIDSLKIDRSFIKDIQESYKEAKIVKAIIGLAQSLNLSVVAEGVELAEQAALLQREQCDEVQGFYFSKPLSVGDLEELFFDIEAQVKEYAREYTTEMIDEVLL
ncbi:EAL domain-containing protein [Priestia koreensis]|uniref:EAL domain-containing protein n=1 Tax=Priestia koreensis TaxID=284581 RepID=UPI001F581816|nr:EAL domain-containing protein [Priestia koreensis]UNL85812.1 EAL domain-containing protein [Priestia koreensis]